MIINFKPYGNYNSNNYSAHALMLILGKLTLWFSYHTIVAFQDGQFGDTIVIQNLWKSTTGKHLNWIDGGNKKNRLPENEFNERLSTILQNHDLVIGK